MYNLLELIIHRDYSIEAGRLVSWSLSSPLSGTSFEIIAFSAFPHSIQAWHELSPWRAAKKFGASLSIVSDPDQKRSPNFCRQWASVICTARPPSPSPPPPPPPPPPPHSRAFLNSQVDSSPKPKCLSSPTALP